MASHCIYCNSDSFGSPCLFSPTNTHVHMGESHKCIYCGSSSSGSGCVYNPYGKIHIKGPEFLNRSNVQSEKTLILKHLLEQISQKNNLNYSSALDRFYKRLSYILSHTAEPLLDALILHETPTYSITDKKLLIESYQLKNKILSILETLQETLQEANLKLPPELIEETILDAILSSKE